MRNFILFLTVMVSAYATWDLLTLGDTVSELVKWIS